MLKIDCLHLSMILNIISRYSMSAAAKRWRYLRRLVFFQQMDFEFAFWQMIYLMTAPHEVGLLFPSLSQFLHEPKYVPVLKDQEL